MVEGGTAHGQGTITRMDLCVLGCPLASVYKGSKGGGCAGLEEGAGGVLLLPGVGLPSPFLVQLGEVEGE